MSQGLAKDANSSAAYSYKVYTPWKFGLSLGHTIGKNVALGAVYEYSDYSSLDSRTMMMEHTMTFILTLITLLVTLMKQ